MQVDQNESVEQEAQEVSSQPEATEQQQVADANSTESKQRNDVEYNWAETRRKMKRLEEQNREMQSALEEVKNPRKAVVQEEEFSNDDIITAGQARKIAEDLIRSREAATVDERLMLKHPDFTTVVSRENIELLKETEPELAQSLSHMPDPYKQGIAAYKMLKKLGIYQESESTLEKEKAQKNSQKPVSVNAITKNSAIGNAHLFENGLTPALKKQLFQEMQQARKGS